MSRIRHCVECPKCFTRYLLGCSPYCNGAYLISAVPYLSEEYTLCCICSRPPVVSRWRGNEVKKCAVTKAAHRRGYGSREEIVPLREPGAPWTFDIEKTLHLKPLGKEGNSR